jgi:hypothetical protein
LAQEIRAERILPIHNEHAPFFKKLFKNYRIEVILPEINTPIEITEVENILWVSNAKYKKSLCKTNKGQLLGA